MCVNMYNMGLLPLEVFTAKTPVHESAVWECFGESYRELHNILFLKCIKIILLPSPSHTQMRAVLLLTALSRYKFLQSWEQEGGEHGPLAVLEKSPTGYMIFFLLKHLLDNLEVQHLCIKHPRQCRLQIKYKMA